MRQGCHGQGKVRKKRKFFKVWEKSLILTNSVKSQGIPFFRFKAYEFSARIFNFSIHFFFLEKTKCMLQSKESDLFDTRRLTHALVVVSGFRRERKKQNAFVGEVKCFALKIP